MSIEADRANIDQKWADSRDWIVDSIRNAPGWLDELSTRLSEDDLSWWDDATAFEREVITKLALLALRESALRASEAADDAN